MGCGGRRAASLADIGARVHPEWLVGFLGTHGTVAEPATEAELERDGIG